MGTAKPACGDHDDDHHDDQHDGRWRGSDHVQVAIPVGGEALARAFSGDVLNRIELIEAGP